MRVQFIPFWIVVIILGPWPWSGYSQISNNYFPDTVDYSIKKKELIQKLTVRLSKIPPEVEKESKSFIKFFKEVSKQKLDLLTEKINSNSIVFDTTISNYYTDLFLKLSKLDRDQTDYIFLLSKEENPNAYSMGRGIVILNLGLPIYLTNSIQLQFVFGHEMAHELGGHELKKIKKNFALQNNKELKSRVDKVVKKEEYNRIKIIESILKVYDFDNKKHSRDNEKEADSIGFEKLRKLNVNNWEAINLLKILDTCDKRRYPNSIELRNYFDGEEFPFLKEYENYEDPVFLNDNEKKVFVSDSFQTHPFCNKRINYLKENFHALDSSEILYDPKFNYFSEKGEFEIVNMYLYQKQYDKAFYWSMLLLKKYPNNSFINSVIMYLMKEMYLARKNHDLEKFVELPNPNIKDNYFKCLVFIENLDLKGFLKMGYNFSEKFNNKTNNLSEDGVYFQLYFSQQIGKLNDVNYLRDIYLEKFPNGKYLNLVQNNSTINNKLKQK